MGVSVYKRKKSAFRVEGVIYSVYFLNTFMLLKSQALMFRSIMKFGQIGFQLAFNEICFLFFVS